MPIGPVSPRTKLVHANQVREPSHIMKRMQLIRTVEWLALEKFADWIECCRAMEQADKDYLSRIVNRHGSGVGKLNVKWFATGFLDSTCPSEWEASVLQFYSVFRTLCLRSRSALVDLSSRRARRLFQGFTGP